MGLGRSEVLRSLRQYLHAQSQVPHHTIDRLEERKGKHSTIFLQRTRRAIVNQQNVSKATLWTLPRVEVECICFCFVFLFFPECIDMRIEQNRTPSSGDLFPSSSF